ncbi:MAG: hypothetical protein FWD27_04870 [Coriobacteriia bacterium]|nr:hypothetical protein [Coriobacteriia bacterium]
MNQKDASRANDYVSRIIDSQILSLGRNKAMAWIIFKLGDSEHSLEVYSSFRIKDNNKILVANLDMYEPTESLSGNESFDYDAFDWDAKGANRYDEWIEDVGLASLSGLKVVDTKVNSCGDLTILLEQYIEIEVFLNHITYLCWRLLDLDLGNLFEMLGTGIGKEQ